MFKTKFANCGSRLTIAPIRRNVPGPVTISAPFDRKEKKQLLFKNRKIRICINATIPAIDGKRLPAPIITRSGLVNSAHGGLHPFRDIPIHFCEINKNGCDGITPAGPQPGLCPASLSEGDNVQFCSSLTVPTIAPTGAVVDVTWKVLREPPRGGDPRGKTCQTDYWPENHVPLVCIKMTSIIRDPPPRRLNTSG